jgi:hypothetical protein
MAMMQKNMDFWFGHTMRALGLYEPDFAALKNCSCRIVDGGMGLARMLGSEPVEFPGAHGGFDSHAAGFAKKLREVFAS